MAEEITCLGIRFSNEEERRAHFRNELRKKLPELKKIDGFPIGEDEDIIALSDPPYYTACPNPWLNDFITLWDQEKGNYTKRDKRFQIKEPYTGDISEGKNNPIYSAHSYHTKVPHPAIMRYILHYTQPGDIVFDGFAGTGMTGVAAKLCANPTISDRFKIEADFKTLFDSEPEWGLRNCISGDLSTVASFISYNYNIPIDGRNFNKIMIEIIKSVQSEYSWLYETLHDENKKGIINYIIWSDVYICGNCGSEIIFWDSAIDRKDGSVKSEFRCNSCGSIQTKRSVTDAVETKYDHNKKQSYHLKKRIPVLINYTFRGRRYEKSPDKNDISLQNKIEEFPIKDWYPINDIISGDEIGRLKNEMIFQIPELFPKRSLIILSALTKHANISNQIFLLITSILQNSSWLYRWRANGKGGTTSGTYYICATPQENNVFNQLERKINDFTSAFGSINYKSHNTLIYTNSSTSVNIQDNTIDYIFTDPPFGANIMYSELNFMWESWLRVLTNNKQEAIESKVQQKSTLEYQNLMLGCFKEFFRILKPNKWMTVEFSNTSAAVWNGIQTALQRAGFMIANISALDKQQGSFKAVTTPTAVKQDLIISCYKPDDEHIGIRSSNDEKSLWDFIADHLKHLPIHLIKENSTTLVIERSSKILYDRLISHLIIKGLTIPIDAKEFQYGLKQRFLERDGMYFTHEQVVEYEEKKVKAPTIIEAGWQIATEHEGIEWLKRELYNKSLKYQDIMPKWMQAITAIRKGDILPELRDILQQNFIEESNGTWRVPDMNEGKDREIIRNKVLMREFNSYVELANNPKSKRMKEVRVEALRAGFKQCWDNKDFQTIVLISDKIPQNLLLEDEQLLMYYDIAKDRV
jgi:DNA modification methylase/DNA-directed RNA polymerase subunit RPC12/RpoP